MKLKITKIPLKPYTKFHFGAFSTDNNVALNSTSLFAHSDMLFAALVNSYSDLFGGAEDFIAEFKNDKLAISSQFYYIEKEEESIYLLPKPLFLDIFTKRDGQHKSRNRIQFVSLKIWEQGFDPSNWIDEKGNITNDYALIQDGAILLTKDEYETFNFSEKTTIFKISDTPKSPIRAHHNASIFYQADVEIAFINKDTSVGLYFFYQADENAEVKLKTATNALAKSGFGGEKSNMGRTMKDPKFEELDITEKDTTDYDKSFTNISLISPKDKNELDKIKYFKTILRGGAGHNGATNLYNVIRMIKEGSLIKDNIVGNIVNIGKDFKEREVLRYGKAFLLPICIKK